jgi:protein-tyrosine phosphatase
MGSIILLTLLAYILLKKSLMKKISFIVAILLVSLTIYAQDSSIVFNPKRAIKLEGTSNFRDLGGYPTTEGKTVAWGKIYRSADISKLTDKDLSTLENLRLETVCDFRGPDELKTSPDKIPTGINYLNLPAGSEKVQINANYMSMNRDSMMLSFYSRTDHLVAKYKPMFESLLNLSQDKSFMFHCTAGKDRTGIGAALILSALGVSKEYVIADYAATNTFWKNETMIEMMIKSGMPKENAKALMAADPAYIILFLNTIDKQYGSMSNFLENEIKLDKKKVKALKKAFLI